MELAAVSSVVVMEVVLDHMGLVSCRELARAAVLDCYQ